jgi:hypothetical protein
VSYYPQNNGYPGQGMQMQPHMQQQAQLPVNPTQIQSQPVNVSPGQPHFLPSVTVPPQIQQYLPLITSVIIMEIQGKVQQNPLRIFMFNLYSMNQYNNREFAELVEICANYIHLVMMNGREYNTIEAAVFGVAQNLVTMMACAQVKPFPALMQVLPPDLQQSAINGVRALETIVREISGSMRPQQGGYNTSMQNRGGMGGAVATMAAASSGGYGLFDQVNRTQPMQGAPSTNNSSGGAVNRYRKQLSEQSSQQNTSSAFQYGGIPAPQVSTMGSTNQQQAHRTVADIISANGSIQQPFKPRHSAVVSELTFEPNKQTATITEVQPSNWFNETSVGASQESYTPTETTVYDESSIPNGMKWVRSDIQPYHPLWDSRTQKPMYSVLDNKTVVAILVNLSEKEKDMMDYQKHVIGKRPTTSSQIPVSGDKADGKIINIESTITDITVVNDESGSLIATCDEAAVNTVRLKAKLNKNFITENACVIKMIVVNPLFVDNNDLENEFRNIVVLLSEAETFQNANQLLYQMSDAAQVCLRPHIEGILVKHINSVLSLEMGLEGVNIDAFSDSVNIHTELSKAYGGIVGESIKANEAMILRRSMSLLSKSDTLTFTHAVVGGSDTVSYEAGTVVYSASDYAYVCVKLHSDELKLTNNSNLTLLVSEDNNKVLHDILEKSFEFVNTDDYLVRLVTADGVVFAVAKGFINKNAILIRRV